MTPFRSLSGPLSKLGHRAAPVQRTRSWGAFGFCTKAVRFPEGPGLDGPSVECVDRAPDWVAGKRVAI